MPESKSPVFPKKQEKGQSYKMELEFNAEAELTDVRYPENMSLEMANNHLVIATLYMAQVLVEKAKGQ